MKDIQWVDQKEIDLIRDIMSLKVSLDDKEKKLKEEADKNWAQRFPIKIIDVQNEYVKSVESIYDRQYLNGLKAEYKKVIPSRINNARKEISKLRKKIFLMVMIEFLFVLSFVLFILHGIHTGNTRWWGIIISFILSIVFGVEAHFFRESYSKKIDSQKKNIDLWSTYDYTKIFQQAEDLININDEMNIVNDNKKKCFELIKEAKTLVKFIPSKYVDYISPVDQTPAIFDMIEIIIDRRADNLKELINTYRDDEFKKETSKHMYTMEKLMQCQISIFNKITQTYSSLLTSVSEQTRLLGNIEYRMGELKDSVDNIDLRASVSVDVNVNE